MVNEKMKKLGQNASAIRTLFEYAKERKKQIGEENVFDFSLGNPSIPTSPVVTQTLCDLLKEEPTSLHGYTSAVGDLEAREAIVCDINRKNNASERAENVYLTCGASSSLSIALHALLCDGDEVVVFAPFFPEYRVFVESAGGVLVVVSPNEQTMEPNIDDLEQKITPKTKAVIVNSPNNPSGAVYSAQTIEAIADCLKRKEQEYGSHIVVCADEPYREIVYTEEKLPYIPHFYQETILCYSFSKSLSLPGERIGYLLVSKDMEREVYEAVCGAGRSLGYVCAPSLFQKTIARCVKETADLSKYRENRDLLYHALTEMGYTVVKPNGAFYLMVKSLEKDANVFCERAKAHELILVPSDSFGITGYVRIAYCVSKEVIERSLPAFELLKKEYEHENH